MNENGKKSLFFADKLDQYVSKKRDEIAIENRKINREESVMKKRKEKMKINSNNCDLDEKNLFINSSFGDKPNLKQQLLSFDFEKRLSAVIKIRKLLSIEKNPPIQEILDAQILPILIKYIEEEKNIQFKFEIAWIFTNIASGTSEQTYKLIEAGIIPILLSLIQGNNESLSSQCVWALGNIAGDSSRCREHLLDSNLLEILLFQINNNKNLSFLRNSVWTLSNLCREKPGLKKNDYSLVLSVLGKLIFSEDIDILTDICWALSYISDGSSIVIQGIINSGILNRINELLMHPDTRVQTPALRTIGNIVTGDDFQTQAVINCSALPCLLTLLNSNKRSIKREACWAISNITAGNVSQIQAVIDANILPIVVKLLDSSETDVKKEAAWVISNATTGGTKEQVDYFIKCNSIPPLIRLLDSTDVRIIKVILEGLENILEIGEKFKLSNNKNPYTFVLEESGGLEKIENLQQHPNDEIYEHAVKILESFFGAEEGISIESGSEYEELNTKSNNSQIPECNFKLIE
jgi:importin subunit alpha-1